MTRLLYRSAGILLTPFLHLWLRKRARRGKEDPARLPERFGRPRIARPAGRLIWLHAASVGEAQSVLTLVRVLLERYPGFHLLVTTGTVTSAQLVARQGIPRLIHQFVPVDTHGAVCRFLDHWRPDLALWVESELWPQLLWQVKERHIPALLVNARLSAKSFARWQRHLKLIRSMLLCFDGIYAGSPEDAERLYALGASHVLDVGNLKYDAVALPVDNAALDALSRATQGRKLWVAASTHANEEQMVAETHRALGDPSLLTVIAPRHATRGDAIAADLRVRGFAVAQRSKNEPIAAATQIYLADTMGELGTFYRLCDLVFLGGSLVAHGGHNPLEPARLSCALLTGPHTHNFSAIIEHLENAGALRIVLDQPGLASHVGSLLTDDAARLSMAEQGAQVVEQARGASGHIIRHIDTILAEAA
jgi:3-deoxy-D-manno-octulosonic-acid transferase